MLVFCTFDGALVLLPDEGCILLVLGLDVAQVVDPEVGAERDALESLLEHLHACLFAALALLKVRKLLPVAVAIQIFVKKSRVRLLALESKKVVIVKDYSYQILPIRVCRHY